jgi:hypothetical protein
MDVFLARIATPRAIHRNEARIFNPDRKDLHWGQAKTEERSMLNRRWVILLISLVAICSIAAGIRYSRSKCHGVNACAAADAESHERDKPSEAQTGY